MIASLRGSATHVGLDRVVVDLHGIGLLVHTPPAVAAACRAGAEVSLATSMIVREDSMTLYGFAGEERDTFELAQTVTGVGPRVAMALLSVLSPQELAAAVAADDIAALMKVPGIGKKGAERIALELRGKLPEVPGVSAAGAAARPSRGGWQEQVAEALVGLGYSAKQSAEAVEAVAQDAPGALEVSSALRAALQVLAR